MTSRHQRYLRASRISAVDESSGLRDHDALGDEVNLQFRSAAVAKHFTSSLVGRAGIKTDINRNNVNVYGLPVGSITALAKRFDPTVKVIGGSHEMSAGAASTVDQDIAKLAQIVRRADTDPDIEDQLHGYSDEMPPDEFNDLLGGGRKGVLKRWALKNPKNAKTLHLIATGF